LETVYALNPNEKSWISGAIGLPVNNNGQLQTNATFTDTGSDELDGKGYYSNETALDVYNPDTGGQVLFNPGEFMITGVGGYRTMDTGNGPQAYIELNGVVPEGLAEEKNMIATGPISDDVHQDWAGSFNWVAAGWNDYISGQVLVPAPTAEEFVSSAVAKGGDIDPAQYREQGYVPMTNYPRYDQYSMEQLTEGENANIMSIFETR
jgi:hypothetical protein